MSPLTRILSYSGIAHNTKSSSQKAPEGAIYDAKFTREQSEALPQNEIQQHWELRAQRPGLQSVLSSRYSELPNRIADIKLQREVLSFLKGYVEHKRVFEFGVGIGRMTRPLSKQAESVYGIDFSQGMIDRAHNALKNRPNVTIERAEITDVHAKPKSFDLVFDSIVLLHVLQPKKLQETIEKMKDLSDTIFIMEPIVSEANKSGSKYSISRPQEEYEKLFTPYTLIKTKQVKYIHDDLSMMLFKKI